MRVISELKRFRENFEAVDERLLTRTFRIRPIEHCKYMFEVVYIMKVFIWTYLSGASIVASPKPHQ